MILIGDCCPPQIVCQNELSTVDFNVTGQSGAVTYSAVNLPPGMFIDSAQTTITGAPTTTGVYETEIIASDGVSTDTHVFIISVEQCNTTTICGINYRVEGDRLVPL